MWAWFKRLFQKKERHELDKIFQDAGLGKVDIDKLKTLYMQTDARLSLLKQDGLEFNRKHTEWHKEMKEVAGRDMDMRETAHAQAMRHYKGDTGAFYQDSAAKILAALIAGVGTKSAQAATTKKALVKTAFDYADLMFEEKHRREEKITKA